MIVLTPKGKKYLYKFLYSPYNPSKFWQLPDYWMMVRVEEEQPENEQELVEGMKEPEEKRRTIRQLFEAGMIEKI